MNLRQMKHHLQLNDVLQSGKRQLRQVLQHVGFETFARCVRRMEDLHVDATSAVASAYAVSWGDACALHATAASRLCRFSQSFIFRRDQFHIGALRWLHWCPQLRMLGSLLEL